MRKLLLLSMMYAACVVFAGDMGALEANIAGRRAFYRNEKNACMKMLLKNLSSEKLADVRVLARVNGQSSRSSEVDLLPRQELVVPFGVETRFRVGKYPLELEVVYKEKKQPRSMKFSDELWIGPIQKDDFQVMVAGHVFDFEILQEKMGFNCDLGSSSKWYGYSFSFFRYYDTNRKHLQATIKNRYRDLDRMLYKGFHSWDITAVNSFGARKYPRIGRNKLPYPDCDNTDASNPELRRWVKDILTKTAETYRDFPAFCGADINSEIRDRSCISFTPEVFAEYKKDTGRIIPQEADGRLAPHYSKIRNFPISRVIPENFPLLEFYRWFWRKGDGWNDLHSLCSETLKKGVGNRPFKTWFAPAVRALPLWGSGGNVDIVRQWTYATPDPINIGVSTDELQAMARGRKGLEIANSTQCFAYRSSTAPVGMKVKNEPAWVSRQPNARYITLAPDMLKIAAWTDISRKVSGVSFYGDNALMPHKAGGYKFTNPETSVELAKMIREVIHPLGPIIRYVPERSPRIAVLESFTSSVFTGKATWGWNGWIFDLNLIMQYGNLQPGIVFEEELLRDGFKDIQVLVMPCCEVLTEPLFQAIAEFQRKGGLIAADNQLVPGLLPDLRIEEVKRSGKAETDTRNFRQAGIALRDRLKMYTEPYVVTSSPDIVSHVRSEGEADYVFLVNDRRTYGDYWGQYGLVQEKGLENSGKIVLNRPAGAVYDAVRHCPVDFVSRNNKTEIAVTMGPGDGKALVVMPKPVAKVKLSAGTSWRDRRRISFSVKVEDCDGRDIRTVLPLEVSVVSPDGRTDDSRYAALIQGEYQQSIIVPLNGTKGSWTITVRDLASGMSSTKTVGVN